MNSGNPTLEMEYYKDLLRCFVPSCKKYRRDFPNSAYLSIPPSLQATWCHALGMNCPKRNLYVCEEHINCDFSTQTHVKFANKTVLMKPAVKSVGCMANIRVTHIAEKVMPSRPSYSTTSHSASSSQYEPSSSPILSSPTKDLAREKDVAARANLLKIIKENPKMYLRVPKQYYWLIDFLAKKCNLMFSC